MTGDMIGKRPANLLKFGFSPTAFSDHRPYAICAFIGGWVLVLAQHAGLAASLALGLAGRDAAHRYMEDKAAREGEGGSRSLWTHL